MRFYQRGVDGNRAKERAPRNRTAPRRLHQGVSCGHAVDPEIAWPLRPEHQKHTTADNPSESPGSPAFPHVDPRTGLRVAAADDATPGEPAAPPTGRSGIHHRCTPDPWKRSDSSSSVVAGGARADPPRREPSRSDGGTTMTRAARTDRRAASSPSATRRRGAPPDETCYDRHLRAARNNRRNFYLSCGGGYLIHAGQGFAARALSSKGVVRRTQGGSTSACNPLESRSGDIPGQIDVGSGPGGRGRGEGPSEVVRDRRTEGPPLTPGRSPREGLAA